MKIKFGNEIVGGSGKSNGNVIAKNRGGYYVRTKVTPTNPRSSRQIAVRALLASNAQAWGSLTEAQRAAWNSAVSSWQKTNIFGDLVKPSGINLYVRLNNNIVAVGGVAISEPPLPIAVGYAQVLALTVSAATGAVTLTPVNGTSADEKAVIRFTEQLNPGVTFVKSKFRQIAVDDLVDATPKVLTAAYATAFGAPVLGRKIVCEVYFVNETTGQQGATVQVSAIVAA
jgi:hypothetical protein